MVINLKSGKSVGFVCQFQVPGGISGLIGVYRGDYAGFLALGLTGGDEYGLDGSKYCEVLVFLTPGDYDSFSLVGETDVHRSFLSGVQPKQPKRSKKPKG